MKRGDFVTMALQGDFGKPRPALVIQSDNFSDIPTTTVLPISSTLQEAPLIRISVKPNKINNLRKNSQVMVDKITTLRSSKIGTPFGVADDDLMLEVTKSLMVFLGLA